MDLDFENTEQGGKLTELVSAGSLHKGDLVMIKEKPCKVVSYSTAKTGKHGAAKAMLTGIDIFTSKKYECTYSTGDMVDAPIVSRDEYTLIDINDEDYVTLMTDAGDTKEDLALPTDEWLKEVVEEIRTGVKNEKNVLVTVLKALGQEKIV